MRYSSDPLKTLIQIQKLSDAIRQLEKARNELATMQHKPTSGSCMEFSYAMKTLRELEE